MTSFFVIACLIVRIDNSGFFTITFYWHCF